MMSFLAALLTIIFFLVCVLITLIVLVQPHHGEGLATAFGGGSGDSFFGTKAVTAAARITVVLGSLYVVLALVLNARPLQQARTLVRDESGGGAGTDLPKDDSGKGTEIPKDGGSEKGAEAPKDDSKSGGPVEKAPDK